MADGVPASMADEGRKEVANEDVNEDMNEEMNESMDEDADDDANDTPNEDATQGVNESVTGVKKSRKGHKKSRNGCRECKRLRQKCDEAKPSCGYCSKRGKFCDYTLPPAKRRGPKPKAPHERPWKEPKAILRPKTTYNKKRKQEVLLWLIHHRVEDVESSIPGRATTAKWREGEEGCVEKEPRTMPDGSLKWFRTPTYHEASKFWKVSASTLTSWWKKRKEILGGEIPQPEIPLVHPSERRKPFPVRPVSPGSPPPPWQVGAPQGNEQPPVHGPAPIHGQMPVYGPPQLVAQPPVHGQPPAHGHPQPSGLDSALQQAQRLANQMTAGRPSPNTVGPSHAPPPHPPHYPARPSHHPHPHPPHNQEAPQANVPGARPLAPRPGGPQAQQTQAVLPPGQVLHPLYRAAYTVDAVHREVTGLVQTPQAIHLDSLLRAISMAHELVAHLNESHKALLYPQSYPYYYHPGPGFPYGQQQNPSFRHPPPHGPHTQPPPQARHVSQGQTPTPAQQVVSRAPQQPPIQGSGPQHTPVTAAEHRTTSSDQRPAVPPASPTARPDSADRPAVSSSKVSKLAAGVFEEERSENEGARQEQQGEPESHKENVSQQDTTNDLGKASEADASSNLDNTSSEDDLNSVPGRGEDGDVNMALDAGDENAQQKDAVEVISSNGDNSGSRQEDSAMTETSDAEEGFVGGNDQDEVGDTTMADAPSKEESTRQAAEASPEA
ncbi:Lysine biosynthesis regulatory protein LYS14 [Cytospora mali]|uniref:Lysine biosynthesis regulatory protein LYS14 n=1 Tax=Cytospora mali TaxID=578113 RepID=A0A194VGB9_CYTMA|nr:Lysine biosynthesis regulatory protein LYS14 [Valsa mali var. pyri (nom. inval.)]